MRRSRAVPSRPRVVMVVENLPVPFDRRVWQEAVALRDAGYDVTAVSPRTREFPQRSAVVDGIRVLRHPQPTEAEGLVGYLIEYSNALFWEVCLLIRLVLRPGFDIIHVANPPDTAFVLTWLAHAFGKRVVFDQHDLSPELYEAKFGKRGLLWAALVGFERASYRGADVVITSNESMRQKALGRGGIAPSSIFVVRNGPDLDRVRAVAPDQEVKSGRARLVVYLGVMGHQEGLDGLLRAISILVWEEGVSDVQFALVGDGTELAAMKRYAQELEIEDHISFTGYLTGERLLAVLSAADVCVSPDPANPLNDQSTMVKTMEYMALAKPVVQYDLVEARVSAGNAALYAARNDERDLAAKIARLLADPAEARRLGEIGRLRVTDELAWKYQIPHLLEAYERALA